MLNVSEKESIAVSIAPSAPGLFTLDSTGKGQAAAANQDGSINTAATAARIGSMITLFATGEGQTSPAGIDGKPASDPLPHPVLPATVTIGGQAANVQYSGGAPGEVAGVTIPTLSGRMSAGSYQKLDCRFKLRLGHFCPTLSV